MANNIYHYMAKRRIIYQAEDNQAFGNSIDDDFSFTCLKSTLTSVKSFSLFKINKADLKLKRKYLCDFD